MNPYEVLKQPLLSEKSNQAREKHQKYTFTIDLRASKEDVSKAVTKLYDVKVTSVRTLITRGRTRRRGAVTIQPTKTKKAVVTLAEGQKIPLFADQ